MNAIARIRSVGVVRGSGVSLSLGPTSFVLDFLTATPSAAYATRRLRIGYSGSLIRVRRASDNAESDIGYDINGNLDTTALLAFVGSSSAFVTTWYDQSGNARNLTQATAAAQPRIVNGGTIETRGSRATVRSLTGTYMASPNFTVTGSSGWTYNLVAQQDATSGAALYNFSIGGSSTDGIYFDLSSQSWFGGAGGWVTLGAATTGHRVATVTNSGVAVTAYLNGTSQGTAGAGGDLTPLFIFRRNATTTSDLSATLSELVLFPSLLSTTDRQTLERDQGAYYSITVA